MESGIARSFGTCMTMGTAATMMAIAEAMGMTLPGASSIPAADAGHPRMCKQAGRRIVDMVWEDLTPAKILTPAAFENAIMTHMAMGGSTNAIIHVVAMARRAGVALSLELFDQISRKVPVIANIRPSGAFLMEDFFYAGGLPALMKMLGEHLHGSALTVNGRTVADNLEMAEVFNADVIRTIDKAIYAEGATAVLKGNLAPRGAVMKPAAAEARLTKHRGKAVVFRDYNHMAAEIERDDLDVTPDHVLVLQNAGPKGGPGMPEWGMLPIPRKLVKAGVRDMLRISDGRMSGTSYGACVLHVTPESFVGGPLALVKTGDEIEVDVSKRLLHSAHLGRGDGAAPRGLGGAAAALRAWLRPHVPGAHRPGRRRLRLRFPGARRRDARAGDPLDSAIACRHLPIRLKGWRCGPWCAGRRPSIPPCSCAWPLPRIPCSPSRSCRRRRVRSASWSWTCRMRPARGPDCSGLFRRLRTAWAAVGTAGRPEGTCCVGGSREEEPVEGITLDGGALVREPPLEPAGMDVTGADGVAGRCCRWRGCGRRGGPRCRRGGGRTSRAPAVVWALATLAMSASVSAAARMIGPVLGSVDMTAGSVSVPLADNAKTPRELRRETRAKSVQAVGQRMTSGNSCMVRRHAAFHSTLLMCVARSQKPMQACKDLPPPPGALGANSLGLPDDEPGDRARELVVEPPVANCSGSCGDSGAISGTLCIGVPISAGGSVGGAIVSGPIVEAADDEPEPVVPPLEGDVGGGMGGGIGLAGLGMEVDAARAIGAGGPADLKAACPPPRASAIPIGRVTASTAASAAGQVRRSVGIGVPSISRQCPRWMQRLPLADPSHRLVTTN